MLWFKKFLMLIDIDNVQQLYHADRFVSRFVEKRYDMR